MLYGYVYDHWPYNAETERYNPGGGPGPLLISQWDIVGRGDGETINIQKSVPVVQRSGGGGEGNHVTVLSRYPR